VITFFDLPFVWCVQVCMCVTVCVCFIDLHSFVPPVHARNTRCVGVCVFFCWVADAYNARVCGRLVGHVDVHIRMVAVCVRALM
jgi:hypothetical protein